MEAISRKLRHGLPFELLYAHDLVIIVESEQVLFERIKVWKRGLEPKALCVNMENTKIMGCNAEPGK
jgi:hypothetical protein